MSALPPGQRFCAELNGFDAAKQGIAAFIHSLCSSMKISRLLKDFTNRRCCQLRIVGRNAV